MASVSRRLMPVGIKDVTFEDGFWGPRIATNRSETLPHEFRQCKETGRIDAFKLAWKPGMPNAPHQFWDSDVAKWVEAASYALEAEYDAELDALLDEVVGLIASAQQEDGYLNTHYTAVEPEKRWTNLRDMHELYCAGHLIEAAVAHYHATGKRTLLDVMCRYSDYIATVMGTGKGQMAGYPGHEEIELALVKLYHATDNKTYLELSKYFVDQRGKQPHYFLEEAKKRDDIDPYHGVRDPSFDYCQAHLPTRQQSDAVGHAVRGGYLYAGMADIAAETHDAELQKACHRIWKSITQKRMYITGGIGSRRFGETFGIDYELPNEIAYAETCAAISLVFFAQRMLNMEANGHYADVMERALYNGVLSGISLDGKKFFYANPLTVNPEHYASSHGNPHLSATRLEWFGCACCPPNIARLLASMAHYAYSQTATSLYVNLYIGGSVRYHAKGQEVTIRQQTTYPWDATTTFTIEAEKKAAFTLMLRIPEWSDKFSLKVNGKKVDAAVSKGYAKVAGPFEPGDTIVLTLAMPVMKMEAHPQLVEDAGCVALQRGPLVYCLEQCDHKADIGMIKLPKSAKCETVVDDTLVPGMVAIEADAVVESEGDWKHTLYRPMGKRATKPVKLRAVPYCLWNNRGEGAMRVWIPLA